MNVSGNFTARPQDKFDVTFATFVTATVFRTIAMYNVLELNVLLFITFKHRAGLYFWSFLVATNGIIPYAIGYIVLDYVQSPPFYLADVLLFLGLVCMVSGQTWVLFSRIHLTIYDYKRIRILRTAILVASCLHIPSIVLLFGMTATAPNNQMWFTVNGVYEKVSVVSFCSQEFVLSAIYICSTLEYLRMKASFRGETTFGLIRYLVLINILVILVNGTIIGFELANLYNLQTSYKAFAYSVKLKLEFGVLKDLVSITRKGMTTGGLAPDLLSDSTPRKHHMLSDPESRETTTSSTLPTRQHS